MYSRLLFILFVISGIILFEGSFLWPVALLVLCWQLPRSNFEELCLLAFGLGVYRDIVVNGNVGFSSIYLLAVVLVFELMKRWLAFDEVLNRGGFSAGAILIYKWLGVEFNGFWVLVGAIIVMSLRRRK